MDLKIAVLPGDGIAPEIIEQAIKAIDATCIKYGHTVGYTYGSVGATDIDKTGNPYPEENHPICNQSD
ncbi:isocitrate/isopropylmalate family dehydrogenase, partial [Odoribacter splanchnicus]|uniref:isocitrate/isopropylmalate family dehydrogenase n=1 Tax=Odoribacter splanchnicus TaxID=28118 RepID=UPI002109F0B8